MFFETRKSQKEDVADYREILAKPENRAVVHHISRKLLANVAPEEAEITSAFIDPLIEMAADGKILTTDTLDEAGGFGGADLMVVVAVQVAITVVGKWLTRFGESDVTGISRRLQETKNLEASIKITPEIIRMAINTTNSDIIANSWYIYY